jgi:hypothetical protein
MLCMIASAGASESTAAANNARRQTAATDASATGPAGEPFTANA